MNRKYSLIKERLQQMREIKKKNSKEKPSQFRRNPKKESCGLGQKNKKGKKSLKFGGI